MKNINLSIAVLLLLYFITGCIESVDINKGRFKKFPKQNRIDLAAQQELMLTADPKSGEIPKQRLLESVGAGLSKSELIPPLGWEEIGPSNIAGRIRSIKHTPSVNFPNQVYIGSASGGLWKTNDIMDELVSWEELSPELASLSVCSMYGDSTELMFGTGEGYFSNNSFPGIGLFKRSNDTLLNEHIISTSDTKFRYIQSILRMDSVSILISTKDAGIQLTRDNGISWEKVLGINKTADTDKANSLIQFSDDVIMASMGIHDSDGIYISYDKGLNWQKSTNGLPDSNIGRIELSNSKNNRRIAYALISDVETGKTLGLYKTINQGGKWYEMTLPKAIGMSDFTRNQSWYNLTISCNPSNPNKLVIGGIDLFMSTNGGLTFRQITHHEERNNLPYVHADQHEIEFLNDNDILVGNDGGISLIEDVFSSERKVTNKNNGLNITQLYSCAIHPTQDLFLSGAQDNGTLKYYSKQYDAAQMVTGGDGAMCFIDRDNPDFQINSYIRNNYWITHDGGLNYDYFPINNEGLFANPAVYCSETNTFFASDKSGYILRWQNPGSSQNAETLRLKGVDNQITSLCISPGVSHRIYFGTNNGELYSLDQTQSELASPVLMFKGIDNTSISSIVINSENENQIITCLYNYGIESIYETKNAGKTWNSCQGNLPDFPVRTCLKTSAGDHSLYIGTEAGVWYTDTLNANETNWYPVNQGIPNVRVDMLRYRQSDKFMLAATHGRGLFGSVPYVLEEQNEIEEEQPYLVQNISRLIYNESDAQYLGCHEGGKLMKIDFELNKITNDDISYDVELKYINANSDDIVLLNNQLEFKKSKKYSQIHMLIYNDFVIENEENLLLEIKSQTNKIVGDPSIEIIIQDDDFKTIVNQENYSEIQIGNGTDFSYEFPFRGYYEDQKTQMFFTAEELIDAGLEKGPISGLQLEIANKRSDIPFENFSVYIKHTNSSGGANIGSSFDEAGDLVYNNNLETIKGWNRLNFDNEFEWDGESNIMIQMCFNNNDWSFNDQVVCQKTDNYSVHYQFADSNAGCHLSVIKSVSNLRPIIKFFKSTGSIKVAVNESSFSSYIKSNQNLLYINENNEIIAKIISGAKALGCVTIEVIGEGINLNCENHEDFCHAQKSFYINTEFQNPYTLEVYYNNDEINQLLNTNWSMLYADDQIYNSTNLFALEGPVTLTEIENNASSFSFNMDSSGAVVLGMNQKEKHSSHLADKLEERFITEENLEYYPTPFGSEIYIKLSDNLVGLRTEIELYNLEGRLLIKYYEILTEGMKLDIPSNLTSGTYIIKSITEDGESYQQKIIKS